MKVLVHHSEKGRSFPLRPSRSNGLGGTHTAVTSSLSLWWKSDLPHTDAKGDPLDFGFVEVEEFPPWTAYGSAGFGILRGLVIITGIGRTLLIVLFFLFLIWFLFITSHWRLSRRSALISESIVQELSHCVLFCFHWLDRIQPCSLTKQKFLFFWLIHFLYQEISKLITISSGLILTWFSVSFSSNL